MNFQLHHGNCIDVLRTMNDNSVDAIVTDPPYGLKFMGRKWDYDVPSIELWAECLRVLKPGGHLLAFAGTRTQHRMAVRIEDAGFEIRDMIAWVYGSGFPKSLDVSKQIDQQEKNRWVKISKAIDNASLSEIAELWINSKNANAAGLSFQRKQTEAGLNTQKNCFAHGSVLLQASHKSCDALAVIAELNLIEAHPTSEGNCSSAQPNAERDITALRSRANTAGSSQENHEATRCMVDFSALQNAWGWQDESKADKLKAVEALKTWLGSKQSSRPETTSALCAALTDDLKLITLSRSKTFLSFDTTRQTACASAISVTITESTAGSLISFTADTLRNKAIDKAAGAVREVVGFDPVTAKRAASVGTNAFGDYKGQIGDVTAPHTDAARLWQGWGTALKPALEPITVARKPLVGAVAENVLAHGTGALNIDGSRVPAEKATGWGGGGSALYEGGLSRDGGEARLQDSGRWPANLIHDGSAEVSELLRHATRFFYCAKASRKDRDDGLDAFEIHSAGELTGGRAEGSAGLKCPRAGAGRTGGGRNTHPTVKPTDLMRYLCRLVTPPGGVVLDPFTGSGSTGKAALLEGFQFIGIEREQEYIEIASARINSVANDNFRMPNQRMA